MRIVTLNAEAWKEEIYEIQTDLKVFMNNIHRNEWREEEKKIVQNARMFAILEQ